MLFSYTTKFYTLLLLGLLLIGIGLIAGFIGTTIGLALTGVILCLIGAGVLVFSASFYTMREMTERSGSPLTKHFHDLKASVEKSIDFLTKDPKTGRWKKRQLEYSNIGLSTPEAVKLVTEGEIEMFRIEAPPNISTVMVYVIGKSGTKIDSIISEHAVQYHVLRGKMRVSVSGLGDVELAAGDGYRIMPHTERHSEILEDLEGILIYEGVDGTKVEGLNIMS